MGETGFLEKRVEGASDEIVVAQRSTDRRAEHKVMILPKPREPLTLPQL